MFFIDHINVVTVYDVYQVRTNCRTLSIHNKSVDPLAGDIVFNTTFALSDEMAKYDYCYCTRILLSVYVCVQPIFTLVGSSIQIAQIIYEF